MATDNRTGNKLPAWATRDSTRTRIDTGTYIGIVKNNLDPARAGRLQIWIPELGGQESDSQSWRTVCYASPYFGSTQLQGKNNSWEDAPQTYGMWAIPPDLDNQVLCTFVNGDPNRGFWYACVPSMASHNMVPGIAAGNNPKKDSIDSTLLPTITDGSVLPTTEFNDDDPTVTIDENFYYNAKPVHQAQYKNLLQQGLDKDPVRGTITSSSQREAPSGVFGISTPGRFVKDTAANDEFLNKLESGTLTEADLPTGPRKGGHQFVMDDGDIAGKDALVRLRTASGHQLLMSDTEKIMYISNSSGSVWIELVDNGQMHIYSSGGFNLRTEGDMNLHSDSNINMHAAKVINMTSGSKINVETNTYTSQSLSKTTIYGSGVDIGSSGDLNLYADAAGSFNASGTLTCVGSQILLNSGGGATVNAPATLPTYVHYDTSRQDANSAWVSTPNAADSIATVLPAHEPWTRLTGVNRVTGAPAPTTSGDAIPGVNKPTSISGGAPPSKTIGTIDCTPKGAIVKDGNGNAVKDGTGQPVRSSAAEVDPGPASAAGKNVDHPMPAEWLLRPDVPNPTSGIGPLSQYQVKCIMAQMAYSESRFDYSLREQKNGNYLGRYQVGAPAFVDTGYMKLEYYQKYSTAAVRYPDAWYGVDNIKSDENYLANTGIQEKLMYNFMTLNYNALTKKQDGRRGIDPDADDLCTVAGMLCVAQLLGPGGARKWRFTSAGGDANGTSGTIYYNRGRYALDILAVAGVAASGKGGGGPTVQVDKNGLTPAAKEAASANINIDDVIQFTNAGTQTGTKERFLKTSETFRYMVLGFAKEFKQKTGQKLVCVSSLRTQDDQQKLYDAWRAAGGNIPNKPTVDTKYGRLYRPVATVGFHGQGLAMDCPIEQLSLANKYGLFEKYGIQWGQVFNDPPHMQFPRGR